MAVGLNKSELAGADSTRAVRTKHYSPPLPVTAEVTLTYPGKLDAAEVLSPVSSRYVRIGHSGAAEQEGLYANGVVWADNWFALHSIIESGEKAQLIYLDPPYSTGLGFASRSQEHAYNDSLDGAAYIEFMRRRLILMREALDDAGSIYLHIGHQMVAELKLVMDEVFGRKNFRNIISRRKCSSKNSTRHQYSNLNDYVLFYTKTSDYIWNQPEKKADAAWLAKEYGKVDERGQYKLVPIHAPGVRNGETGKEWRGMLPPVGKHWQYIPAKLDELDAAGEIYWSKNGNPRRKVYLPENKGVALTDYWDDYRDAHHQSVLITGYPTEKNFEMMKMLVAASSEADGLVIDPFCGSGSTLHAAEMLGRRWIGIDESISAVKTTVKRLRNGRQPMGDYVNSPPMADLFSETAVEPTRREHVAEEFELYVDSEIAALHPEQTAELSELIR
ncbi:site-specific DNA-methyltransferase [Burkholderia multivorans]|uniref:site-specific DNA-methyltransferase n=1 Tax=Burkholderia multivorans TaxID=87883 RepID=UPI000F4DFBC5|nr:site-specific DNA-methyltransferase [Burkholderia multivorans]AYY60053.1 site-specific DNA-methyltransferase [Burkholderia multivorans]MBU9222721.1 site-specific DNA-methyltransferase [Burkholderia multivorans]MBU9623992.1 site-specific DNA-methyltransferase [Burkholderia multivorans]MCA8410253.1 site-specific DNA-methyltransferase [Burkholderia multivorans]MCA8437314.1 site-specific DNA-methyltransferase [Burkholderia multivorans]